MQDSLLLIELDLTCLKTVHDLKINKGENMKVLKRNTFRYIGSTDDGSGTTSEMAAVIDENGSFKLEISLLNSERFFSNETQHEEVIDFMRQVLDKSKTLSTKPVEPDSPAVPIVEE